MRGTWLALTACLVGCALSREGLFESDGAGGQAATATATATGTGAGGAAASTTSTGGNGSEDCLDGVDNDGNALVDCADPACNAGFECVPEAPSGWQHQRMRTGNYGELTAEPCPDDSAPVTTFHDIGDPADCSPCGCGAIQGVTCSAAQLHCWYGTNCIGTTYMHTPSMAGCSMSMVSGGYDRCTMGVQSQPGGGSCPPSGGVPTVSAPFASQNDACAIAQTGAGCDAGQACVPRGEAPYDGAICIAQSGEAGACPGGWSNLVIAYETFTDDRDCAACDCMASPTCSGASFTLYDFDNCVNGGQGTVTISGNSCVDVENQLDNAEGSIQYNPPTAGGSCAPQGGGAVGAVNPGAPTSHCCQ